MTCASIGETALEQGKVALEEVRKPWYAAVGAGDFAYEQLQAQLSQLPAEVQARVRKLQTGGRQLDAAALRSAVENAPSRGRKAYGRYAAQARETYESLAHRGELVVRRMRRSQEVKETFEKAEDVVADAGQAVEQGRGDGDPAGSLTTTRSRPRRPRRPGRRRPSGRRRPEFTASDLAPTQRCVTSRRPAPRFGTRPWCRAFVGRPRGEASIGRGHVRCRAASGGSAAPSPLGPLWTARSAVHSGHGRLTPLDRRTGFSDLVRFPELAAPSPRAGVRSRRAVSPNPRQGGTAPITAQLWPPRRPSPGRRAQPPRGRPPCRPAVGRRPETAVPSLARVGRLGRLPTWPRRCACRRCACRPPCRLIPVGRHGA